MRSRAAARGNGFAKRVSASTGRGVAPQHHRTAAHVRYRRNRFGVAGARSPAFASGSTGPRSHCAARGNGFAKRVSASTGRGGTPQHHRTAARDRYRRNRFGVAGARRPGFAKASAGRPGFASGNNGPRSRAAARENTFAIRVSVSTSRGGAPQLHRSRARDRYRRNRSGVAGARRPGFATASAGRPGRASGNTYAEPSCGTGKLLRGIRFLPLVRGVAPRLHQATARGLSAAPSVRPSERPPRRSPRRLWTPLAARSALSSP